MPSIQKPSMSKNGKVVALTGGTGFIGSHILASLLAKHYRVRVLARNPRKITLSHPDLNIIEGSLHTQPALNRLVDDADVVIHCAGRVRGASAEIFHHDNCIGTENVLTAAARSQRPADLILISSLAASNPSISDYAHSKHESEMVLIQSNLPHWCIIRPPAVYGPGDTELKPVFDWMKRGYLWVPGTAKQHFSLLHISDLVHLIVQQLSIANTSKMTLEPDDGKEYTWQDIQRIGEQFFNKEINIIPIPQTLLFSVAHTNVLFSRLFNYSPMLTPAKIRELLHKDWLAKGTPPDWPWKPKVDLKMGLSTLYSRDDID